MSASVTYDVMTLLSELGYGEVGRGVYDPLLMQEKAPAWGILVEQRTTTGTPDVLCGDDTVFLNIQVRGEGSGERGRNAAHNTAMAVFRDLSLVMDRTINGTFYEIITPDSSPYEVRDGDHCDVLLGLRVVRYYREDMTS